MRGHSIFQVHSPMDLQIVHLDLKSHNILLGRGGVAKIADVGLAKIMSRSQTRASATGTFDWASWQLCPSGRCPAAPLELSMT